MRSDQSNNRRLASLPRRSRLNVAFQIFGTHWKKICVLGALVLVNSALEIASVGLVISLLATVIFGNNDALPISLNFDHFELHTLLAIVSAFVLAKYLFHIVVINRLTFLSNWIVADLSRQIYELQINANDAIAQGAKSGEAIRQLIIDVNHVGTLISNFLLMVAEAVIAFGLIYLIISVDISGFPVFLGAFFCFFVGYTQIARVYLDKLSRQRIGLEGQILSFITSTLRSIITVRTLSSPALLVESYGKIYRRLIGVNTATQTVAHAGKQGFEPIILLCVVYFIASSSPVTEDFKADLLAFGVLGLRTLPCFHRLANLFNTVKFIFPALEKIGALIPPESISDHLSPIRDEAVTHVRAKDQRLDLPHKHQVRLSFEARVGVPLIIFGPSGIGKTTLALSMIGIGENIHMVVNHKHKVDTLRQFSVYMSQNSSLLPLDLEKLLEVYSANAEDFDYWMHYFECDDALQKLQNYSLHEFSRVPLSGGEIQRVNLALVMSSSRQVKIFDEPTSNLDIQLTQKFMEALKTGDFLSFVITHDRSFSEYFNNILELNSAT